MSGLAVALVAVLAALVGGAIAWVVQRLRFAPVAAVAQASAVTAEALKDERLLRAESERARNSQLEFTWEKEQEDARTATDAEVALARWRAARRVLAHTDGSSRGPSDPGAVPSAKTPKAPGDAGSGLPYRPGTGG